MVISSYIDVNGNRVEEEFDMEVFEKEQDELRRLFPDVGFDLSITLEDLDTNLSTLDKIFIDIADCCDYEEEPQPFFIVVLKKKDETHITYRTVIQRLNEIKYTKRCDHNCLEMIKPLDRDTNNVFELWFGS